ncbi:hypothetical protein [Bacillus sp. 2205SS5-2]|uniref:hypothetical protein n=1 Tax=Bacillus sp. 2205SS5-2 TaxID=3109031 RepID=UPI003007CDD9
MINLNINADNVIGRLDECQLELESILDQIKHFEEKYKDIIMMDAHLTVEFNEDEIVNMMVSNLVD